MLWNRCNLLHKLNALSLSSEITVHVPQVGPSWTPPMWPSLAMLLRSPHLQVTQMVSLGWCHMIGVTGSVLHDGCHIGDTCLVLHDWCCMSGVMQHATVLFSPEPTVRVPLVDPDWALLMYPIHVTFLRSLPPAPFPVRTPPVQ